MSVFILQISMIPGVLWYVIPTLTVTLRSSLTKLRSEELKITSVGVHLPSYKRRQKVEVGTESK